MGMFDSVKFEYILPHSEVQDELFQTKDLDCCLDTFIVDETGRWHRDFSLGTKPIDFSGVVTVYTYTEDDNKIHEWYEYDLHFKNGMLQHLCYSPDHDRSGEKTIMLLNYTMSPKSQTTEFDVL